MKIAHDAENRSYTYSTIPRRQAVFYKTLIVSLIYCGLKNAATITLMIALIAQWLIRWSKPDVLNTLIVCHQRRLRGSLQYICGAVSDVINSLGISTSRSCKKRRSWILQIAPSISSERGDSTTCVIKIIKIACMCRHMHARSKSNCSHRTKQKSSQTTTASLPCALQSVLRAPLDYYIWVVRRRKRC